MASSDERQAAFTAARAGELRRLTRIQRDVDAEVVRQLQAAQAEIRTLLASAGSEPSRRRLEALQREIERVLNGFARGVIGKAVGALPSAWDAGVDLLRVPMSAAGVSMSPVLNPRALLALEQSLTGYISDISVRTANRINAEIAQVMIGVRPASEAISNVERLLGGAPRTRARQIVNDEIGRAYSAASQQSMERAQQLLPGLRKRWIKSGKRHPRPEHVAAHGQVVAVDESYVVGGIRLLYPRDPTGPLSAIINCGCLSIPVTDGSTWGKSTVRLDPLDASVPMTIVRDGA